VDYTLGGGPETVARQPLLALVEDFPDLFKKEVLERLDPSTSRCSGVRGVWSAPR
jgi:hypothetical protein